MVGSDRVAAAAKAALAGLHGLPGPDRPRIDGPGRSPGIRVLFEPVPSPLPDKATDASPMTGAPPMPEDVPEVLDPSGGDDASRLDGATGATGARSGIWNPFRPATDRDAAEPDGPTSHDVDLPGPRIVHLHTRRSGREATVIATVEHAGRRAHGTAVGPSAPAGVLHAVAQATIAALGRVVPGPVPAEVEHVTLSPEQDPSKVSVAILWTDEHGRQRLVAEVPAAGDPPGAVMRATLEALHAHLTPSGGRAR